MWVQGFCPELGPGAEQPIHASAKAPLCDGVWGCAPELAHPLASGFRSKHTGWAMRTPHARKPRGAGSIDSPRRGGDAWH